MADESKKRSSDSNDGPDPKRPRFPSKSPRKMATSTAYPSGEVNVKSFVHSHESEIKRLEKSMRIAKKSLNRRAFQNVPFSLRRRTASHNPQRVPKRLRTQARKEVKEDNTPIVRGKSGSGVGKGRKGWLRKEGIAKSIQRRESRAKKRNGKNVGVTAEPMEGVETQVELSGGTAKKAKPPKRKHSKLPVLANPDPPPSRFRRRQKDKTWLPTHLWHTKRARMTPPKEPLWRFAIPLAPVAKAYRLTHRAAAIRGAVAWDMSYMATISLEGVEASLSGLLRSLQFAEEADEDPWQNRGLAKRWRHGTRVWEGWIYERETKPRKALAFVTVIWSVPEEGTGKRKAFIRVHPSAFLSLWTEVVRVSKMQKPAVVVEDLRFEMGSIDIMGPAAAETLASILAPSNPSEDGSESPQAIFGSLAKITDPGVLPPGALFAFPISDPRLRDPPTTSPMTTNPTSEAALMKVLAAWPVDDSQMTPIIFDRSSRLAASRLLPSQKAINRRKEACTLGGYPEPRSTDPKIPILVYISKQSKSWTVLLPWKCVPHVWRGITRYPVSTGGNPRFGGLKERRQVDFERSTPSFPFDHPGTDAGWGWELQERVVRKHEWTKRPKGKRIEWTTIDLGGERKGEVGDPWSCDWERLIPMAKGDAPETTKAAVARSPFYQIPVQDMEDLISGDPISSEYFAKPHLFAVKINMDQRGTPTTCARIYRLPKNNPGLRSKWLSLQTDPKPTTTSKGKSQKSKPPQKPQNPPKRVRTQALAESLLRPGAVQDGPPKAGEEEYPIVPDEEDLIGYVTTGNYNLAEGIPTAIANIALHKVSSEGKMISGGHARVCIVREVGKSIGRLATWEVV
jgi:ribonuclease P/MRP protein subunit POP1